MPPFLLATWALLLAPGPTNMLLAASSARGGLARTLRLLPAVLAAYMLAIVPLSFAGESLAGGSSTAARVLRLAAALWVLWLALRLWNAGAAGRAPSAIGARTLFVTTLLNPKVLVLGLVLLPPPATDAAYVRALAMMALSILAAGAVWARGGAMLTRVGQGGLERACALCLALLSAGLTAGALHG